MNAIFNLVNLPDALEWVHCRQEIFSVLSRIFAAPDKRLTPVLVPVRVS